MARNDLSQADDRRLRLETEIRELTIRERVADAFQRVEQDRVVFTWAPTSAPGRPERGKQIELAAPLPTVEGAHDTISDHQSTEAGPQPLPATVVREDHVDDLRRLFSRVPALTEHPIDGDPLGRDPRLISLEEDGAITEWSLEERPP